MDHYVQLAAIVILVLLAGYFAYQGYKQTRSSPPIPLSSAPATAGQVADLHASVKAVEAKLETTAAVQDIQKGVQALHQKVDTLHQKVDSIKADTQTQAKLPDKVAAAA